MAFVTVGQNEFYSQYNTYLVTIQKRGAVYAGATWVSDDFILGPEIATISRSRNTNNPQSDWVIPTRCSISLHLTQAAQFDWIDRLANEPEGDYMLRVDWRNPVNQEITNIFFGYFLSDQLEYNLEEGTAPICELTATDGLEILKAKTWPAQSAERGRMYGFDQYIIRALSELPYFDDQYSNNDRVLTSTIRQYPSELSSSDHILTNLFVRNSFYTEDGNGVAEFINCGEILESILNIFDAKIVQWRGAFLIFEDDDLVQANTRFSHYTLDNFFIYLDGENYNYPKLANESVVSTVNTDAEIDHDESNRLFRSNYPVISYLPTVKEVVLNQEGLENISLFTGSNWSYEGSDNFPQAGSSRTVTGVGVTEYDKRVLFGCNFYAAMFSQVDAKQLVVIGIKIQVGNKYAYLDYSDNPHPSTLFVNGYRSTYGMRVSRSNQTFKVRLGYNVKWTTNTDARIYIGVELINYTTYPAPYLSVPAQVEIETPLIDNTGDVIMDVFHDAVYRKYNDLTPYTFIPANAVSPNINEVVQWEILSPNILIGKDLSELTENDGIRTIKKTINNKNSEVIEFNHNFGDFPDDVTNNAIWYRNAQSVMTKTNLWQGDNGTGNITSILLNKTANLRNRAKKKIDINTIYNNTNLPPEYISTMDIKESRYVFMSQDIVLGEDSYNGVLYNVDQIPNQDENVIEILPVSPTFIDLSDRLVIPNENVNPILPDFTDDGTVISSQPDNDPIDYYYDVINNVTDNFIDLTGVLLEDVSGFTEASINRSWTVHVGGTKYILRKKTQGQLLVGECAIDHANNKILFPRNLRGATVTIEKNPRYETV